MSKKGLGRKNPLIQNQNLNYSEKLIKSGIFGENLQDNNRDSVFIITVYELGILKGYIKSLNMESKGIEITSNKSQAKIYTNLKSCQNEIKFLMSFKVSQSNYYGYCIEER